MSKMSANVNGKEYPQPRKEGHLQISALAAAVLAEDPSECAGNSAQASSRIAKDVTSKRALES